MDRRLRFADSLFDSACAFLIAAVSMMGTANTQAGGCLVPGQVCTSGSGFGTGVNVSARQSGNGVPQTPSGSVMSVLIPITVDVATVGVATVAIPAVGTATVAGDVMVSAGMITTRGGIIGDVTLATLINRMSGDVPLDSNGQVVAPAVTANVGDVGFNGHQWYCSFGNVAGGGAACGASPNTACVAALPVGGLSKYAGIGTDPNIRTLCGTVMSYSNPPMHYAAYLYSTDHCVTGHVASGSSHAVDPAAPKVSATNAQIQDAIKTRPDSWPSIYNSMDHGPTLALTNGPTSDLCYHLYSDSRTGSGVPFSTGGPSWSNNGCAMNSTPYPSATMTTTPTIGTQTKMNADGSETTTNTMTTRTMTVVGTNDRTNPVVGRIATTTTTAVTVTSTDGSTTTIMETTTDRASSQAGTNTSQQQKDQTQSTTAMLTNPDIRLCDRKTRTFGGVLDAFRNTIRVSAVGIGVQGFFMVSASGSCSQRIVPQTDWTPSIVLGPTFCSPSASLVYQIAGYIVLVVAAFTALAIVFL